MLSEENSINVYVGSNMNPAFCCLFVLGGQAQSWSQSRFWSLSASQVSITNSVFGVYSTTSVKQTSSGQTPEKLWLLFYCAVETCPEFSSIQFSSVSVMSDFLWPHEPQHTASLSITNSQSLPKLMSIESVMPSNHLIFCCPLLLLPSSFPTSGSFQRVSSSHQVAKILEFQLQHQSFQWTPRTDLL